MVANEVEDNRRRKVSMSEATASSLVKPFDSVNFRYKANGSHRRKLALVLHDCLTPTLRV